VTGNPTDKSRERQNGREQRLAKALRDNLRRRKAAQAAGGARTPQAHAGDGPDAESPDTESSDTENPGAESKE
jgi:hypothetical protein